MIVTVRNVISTLNLSCNLFLYCWRWIPKQHA